MTASPESDRCRFGGGFRFLCLLFVVVRSYQGDSVPLEFIMNKVHRFRQRIGKLLEIFLVQKDLMLLEFVLTDLFAFRDRNVKVFL